MAEKQDAESKRGRLQLQRLVILIDVVYAIVLWRCFVLIPKPGQEAWHWSTVGSFVAENIAVFVVILVGVIVTIIYWLQSNVLFSNLERTDGRHTFLSIFQVFFLLIFLFSIRIGVELESSAGTRAFESIAAMLVGVPASLGWSHAVKKKLLLSDVSKEDADEISYRILAEPITAIITIPLAFVGPIVWEVSWLSYPLVVRLLKRRGRAKAS
jgi:uncharacterized membrane protein